MPTETELERREKLAQKIDSMYPDGEVTFENVVDFAVDYMLERVSDDELSDFIADCVTVHPS